MRRLLIAVLLAVPGLVAAQSIYKVQMPDGSILFTDTPPQGSKILEERDAKPTARPAAAAPARSGALPGTASQATMPAATARAARPIDAAMQEIDDAQRALVAAQRRLELGREPLPGERLGLAGGGSRLSPDYEARVAALERDVAEAEARLRRAHEARNAAR